MRLALKSFAAILLLGSLNSCYLFDSGVEWRGGPYELAWIDTSENISLYWELGNGSSIGRVEPTVFAVGWDGRYAVAKQHPGGDKSKTNYFIVDSKRDGPLVDVSQAVMGPLDISQYNAKAQELKLPPFTKVLKSLE